MDTPEPIAFSFFRRLEICTQTTLISASLSYPQILSMMRSAETVTWGDLINSSIN